MASKINEGSPLIPEARNSESRKSIKESRESLKDPNYKGEDYEFPTEVDGRGPIMNRRCTDIFCLVIFLVFAAGMGFVSYYGFENGDPRRLISPLDADGQFCGYSQGYTDYPYLYYAVTENTVIDWFAYAVCVSECPTSGQQVDCHLTDQVTECPVSYYDSYLFLTQYCMPEYNSLSDAQKGVYDNLFVGIGIDDIQEYWADVECSWKIYCISLGTVMVLIFIYNVLLYYFAEILTWISIIAVGAGLLMLGFFVKDYSTENYPEGDTTQKWLNIAAYTIWGLFGLYCLCVLCLYYSIKISAKVLKVSARIIYLNMKVVLVPIFGMVLCVVWVGWWFYDTIWLFSVGEVTSQTVPGSSLTYKTIAFNQEETYMVWFHVFGFFWVAALIIACTQYVIIVCVATWYFTVNSDTKGRFSLCSGLWWCIRYNLGSLMFGSFLIAVVWLIRVIFEYINRKVQNAQGPNQLNRVAVALMNCCRCCIDCCHRFVKYINKNAYCQVVLTGEPFCIAAINGFCLILKHAATFSFTSGIGAIFTFLGKLTVSVGNTIVGYILIDQWPEYKNEINSPIGPLIVVFLLSYLMATMFMSIYTTTATCILHCLYADVDICKQLSRDEIKGLNRPREMTAIVQMLAKTNIPLA